MDCKLFIWKVAARVMQNLGALAKPFALFGERDAGAMRDDLYERLTSIDQAAATLTRAINIAFRLDRSA